MNTSLLNSESVVGSLCREAELVSRRSFDIIEAIKRSRDEGLLTRLKNELKYLNERKQEIMNTAIGIRDNYAIDNLSINFLIEIARRGIC